MVKYGGASSARIRLNGAAHSAQSSDTRRYPRKRLVLPQAGHRHISPRNTAAPNPGTGHAGTFTARSGVQITVGAATRLGTLSMGHNLSAEHAI
jgi:hypothetical protein